jgi:hypothetical protein
MQKPADRNTYFSSMSQAMAEMCDVFATVMTKDLNNVPTDGIWFNVAFPTLQRFDNQGKVNFIDVCNPDTTQVQKYWLRTSSRLHRRRDNQLKSIDAIERRDSCGAADGAEGDIDEGTDFEVIW